MRYYQAIVLLLVACAVLSGIQLYVQSVDPSAVPEELRWLWSGIQFVFTTSAVAPLFTFIRNILGYAENWFEANPEERRQMSYEAGKLAATWTKYETLIKGYSAAALVLTTGTPIAPYAVYVAGAAALATDLATKAIKDLAKTLTVAQAASGATVATS